jgi:thiol-disulfide isomerase/thioredoxin
MWKLFVAAVLIAVTCSADNPNSTKDNKEPKKLLMVGDPVPVLRASRWLQGEEVNVFQPGKIYVVEFWATWCGPCIMIMPHLAELQAQYKDKDVTFIGYSARDANNSEEKVAAFVKQRGPKLRYTFAYADDRTTYDAWMKAAGQNGIPCAFVVDKAGRIAFIGHPLFLGVVLPKVIAGTATIQAISNEVDKIGEEISAVSKALRGPDPKAGLQALADFDAKYPPLANNPYWLRERFGLLLKAGEVDEAKQLAEAVVAKATEQDEPMALHTVSTVLRSEKGKKELMALAVKAAQAMGQVSGDKDAWALITLADTYLAVGDKAKAKEYARKAVEAAAGESGALKQYIEKQARMFDDDKQ